jgi:flagellar motor switch protein FliN/FliY
MQSLNGVPHLVVRCHPSIADGVRDIATAHMQTSGFSGRLIVMGDPEQRLGDGKLEWVDGGLVRDIGASLQGHRQEDHRLPRRQSRPGQARGERPLSASDNDVTAHEGITFEEMAAPGKGEGSRSLYREAAPPTSKPSSTFPVRISVVLGRTKMPVSELLRLDVGTVIELDRQVGEAVEIFVNDRLVARGEIVLVESKLGVTMTEIIKPQ